MARKDNKGRNLQNGEYQKADGRYEYRYYDERAGKRVSVYAGNLAELRELERKIQRELEDGLITSSEAKKMDLNTLFLKYMEINIISPTTRDNYNKMWNNHVSSGLGIMKIVQIKPSDVKRLYASMSSSYAMATIKLIHDLVYPTLEMAVEDDIIRKNPAKGCCSGYGKEAKEKNVLSAEEQEKLFAFLEQSNNYSVYLPMLQIMIGLALRCGELIGLTWDDVDMKACEVNIDHQLVYKNFGDGFRFHLTSPKTSAGNRVIPMTHEVRRAFLKIKETQLMLGVDHEVEVEGRKNFVFVGRNNLPMMPTAVNNMLNNVVAAYNRKEQQAAKFEKRKAVLMPHLSAHCLRHTGCTRMAEAGMDIKVLQYIMGHSEVGITLQIYNHITDKDRINKEIDKLNKDVKIV